MDGSSSTISKVGINALLERWSHTNPKREPRGGRWSLSPVTPTRSASEGGRLPSLALFEVALFGLVSLYGLFGKRAFKDKAKTLQAGWRVQVRGDFLEV